MQVRKVVTRSGRGFRGYFPSKKLNRMVEYESLLERDAILLFEFSSGVVSYQEQPEMIYYNDGDKTRQYFPDFEVVLITGEIIHVEVKPYQRLNTPELLNKFGAIAAHYQTHRAEFKILTEKNIRREPLLSNLKRLASLKQSDSNLDRAFNICQQRLLLDPICSVSALSQGFMKGEVFRLIALGKLICNLEQKLDSNTNFVRIRQGDHDATLLL